MSHKNSHAASSEVVDCNLCDSVGLSPSEFGTHFFKMHSDNNKKLQCPICKLAGGGGEPVGTRTWGYSSHLWDVHGPESGAPKKRAGPSYLFSLVVCQRRDDGRFLLIEECCQQGYWLPGGRVDPGETYSQAAVRETLEEAGVHVELTGLIATDVHAFSDGWKQRIIFHAHPLPNDDAPLKTIADYESKRALWVTYEELLADLRGKRKHLRGREPITFFGMVRDHPEKIVPMDFLIEQ